MTTRSSPGALSTVPTPSSLQATIWMRLPSPSWPGGVAHASRPSPIEKPGRAGTPVGASSGLSSVRAARADPVQAQPADARVALVSDPHGDPLTALVPADIEAGRRGLGQDDAIAALALTRLRELRARHGPGTHLQLAAIGRPGRPVCRPDDGSRPADRPVAGRVDDGPPHVAGRRLRGGRGIDPDGDRGDGPLRRRGRRAARHDVACRPTIRRPSSHRSSGRGRTRRRRARRRYRGHAIHRSAGP